MAESSLLHTLGYRRPVRRVRLGSNCDGRVWAGLNRALSRKQLT
jgi:hypothetical protein